MKGQACHGCVVSPRTPENRLLRWQIIIVAIVACALYLPTLRFDLLWDDPKLLGIVHAAVETGGLPRLLTAEFLLEEAEPLGLYRPVVLLSLWVDSLVAPYVPVSFHLSNVLLHAVCSSLVFVLLRAIGFSGRGSLAGSLLFAVHPVHCESTAFVSGRTDLMATALVLVPAAMWFAERRTNTPASIGVRLVGLACFFLAINAKEVAYVFPLVAVAGDAMSGHGRTRRGVAWKERHLFWGIGWSVCIAAALVVRVLVAGIGFGVPSGAEARGGAYALQVAATLATYLRLLLFPWPLSAYYTAASVAFSTASLAAALLFLAGVAELSRAKYERVGVLVAIMTIGFLVPVMRIVPLGSAFAAERFLYLPSIGICVAMAAAVDRGVRGNPRSRVLLWCAVVVIAMFAFLTVRRSAVWRNSFSLYSSLVATAPDYADGHYNLGVVLASQGRNEEAITSFQSAIRIDARHDEALYNLGVTYGRLGRHHEAVDAYRRALELRPAYAEAAVNLGIEYGILGALDQAGEAFLRAIRMRPDRADAHYNLGIAEMKRGRTESALSAFEQALVLQPGMGDALFNAALLYQRRGEHKRAYDCYESLRRSDALLAERLRVLLRVD